MLFEKRATLCHRMTGRAFGGLGGDRSKDRAPPPQGNLGRLAGAPIAGSYVSMSNLRESTRCSDACVTDRQRPIWARAAEDAGILLQDLSALQRQALGRDLDRIEAVLDRIPTPASASPPPRSFPI